MRTKKTTRTKKTKKMKTSNKFVPILVLIALVAGATATSLADDKKVDPRHPYALIFGTIYGPDSRPLPGVKIKMRREGDKKSIDLVSDNRGEFAHRFPAGKADYVVWADLKDKQAAQKTEVKVNIERDER